MEDTFEIYITYSCHNAINIYLGAVVKPFYPIPRDLLSIHKEGTLLDFCSNFNLISRLCT